MDDYSQLGREKLHKQAQCDLDFIRCPLDSAIMVITGGVAGRTEDGKVTYRGFERYPISSKWTVVRVDLECSACRRHISDLPIHEDSPGPVPARTGTALERFSDASC